MTGIAGFGNCQIYMPGLGIHTCIDFHGKTPLAATPDMWEDLLVAETRDGFGFVLEGHVNDLGYQAVTTPGSLKAYSEAVAEFGSYEWADICQPAIGYARDGFLVRPAVHGWWVGGASLGRVDVEERLRLTASGRRLYYTEDNSLKQIGDVFKNPDLAHTLERIAAHGVESFYSGEIAQEIA